MLFSGHPSREASIEHINSRTLASLSVGQLHHFGVTFTGKNFLFEISHAIS
jgi:hypothetical protein